MSITNKGRRKSREPYDMIKAAAVKKVAFRFECSQSYVRMCINPSAERTNSIIGERIAKAFEVEYQKISQAIN